MKGLTDACRRELERKLRGKPATKAELLEEDRQAMLPLPPQPFESRRGGGLPLATRYRLSVSTATNYSVPTAYAHHAVTAIGGIEKVRFVVQDRVVAEHLRDWDKENVHYDPVHYLALLEAKTRSPGFRQAVRRLGPTRGLWGIAATAGRRTGQRRPP